MLSPDKQEFIDRRMKERQENLKQKHWDALDPTVPKIDAVPFSQPISDVAEALTNLVEREGVSKLPVPTVIEDIGMILRQVTATYNAIRWVNADDTRYGLIGYRGSYTVVTLPLVRTIIDGLYNATALLDDPSRGRNYRISGIYRMRRALQLDQPKYANNPDWQPDLDRRRSIISRLMQMNSFTEADLDDRSNKWPLLSQYLKQEPRDSPHRMLMRQLTELFWEEYSAVSHVSFDALLAHCGFLAKDRVPHEMRKTMDNAAMRHLTMHYARAAGLVACLLTEVQHYFKFDGHNIDKRLRDVWMAMQQLYEVRELYAFRYNGLLREPEPAHI